MERFKLGYGDANTLALTMGKSLPDLGLTAGATWQAILLNDSGPALLNMLRN